VFQTCWAELIKAAKSVLPFWNVDTQLIWDRFVAFNRARGNQRVPAGYLLDFMRRWQTSASGGVSRPGAEDALPRAVDPKALALLDQIKAAPSINRQFHASDLCRAIGQAAYDARVLDVIRQFGCARFAATLAVHGQAVLAGEITRWRLSKMKHSGFFAKPRGFRPGQAHAREVEAPLPRFHDLPS
jgi:hypothetical protein